jgi:hypothetical protein
MASATSPMLAKNSNSGFFLHQIAAAPDPRYPGRPEILLLSLVRTIALWAVNASNLVAESRAAFAAEMLHVQIFEFLVKLDQNERHRSIASATKRNSRLLDRR